MDRRAKVLIRAALLAAALPALGSAPATTRADDPPPRCCFANPKYSGTCEVELGEGETCGAVLAYLNNPRASGKTYCGNTDIRGGWREIVCQKESPPPEDGPR